MYVSDKQKKISATLGVDPNLQPETACADIVRFMVAYAEKSNAAGFVLGISGGQDSTLCGKLAQMAVDFLNSAHGQGSAALWALRLPYGIQADAEDAELALNFIQPTKGFVYPIDTEVRAVVESYEQVFGKPMSDYAKGNVKARARMVIQYAVASENNLLVLGTDHAAEAVTGFYTKYGDGAADLTPLAGLTKRQGRRILEMMGAPERLYQKTPTADLEDQKPQLPDEEALGLKYHDIDRYLELHQVEEYIVNKIEYRYDETEHKRRMPATRFDKP